jgi:TPP-dependent pyruvate/acetoin dehydrogenase alpha subunit
LKRLPILFVCENNSYAIHTHQNRRQGTSAICERARAFGMPAERIEANNVLALNEWVHEMTPAIRAGGGPHFVEVMTYRWREHVGPGFDYQLGFRSEEEWQPWVADDQVARRAHPRGSGQRGRRRVRLCRGQPRA